MRCVFSPDQLRQTPLQSCGCHKEASGPEPSQHGQSPTTENKLHEQCCLKCAGADSRLVTHIEANLPEFWAAAAACWLHSQRKESGRAGGRRS